MKAEYLGDKGCLQRDSAEREEYAGARSIDNRETEEADGADLLERILDRENLNRAYERVCKRPCFVAGAWPLEATAFKSLIQKNKAVSFPVQRLYSVTSTAAKTRTGYW